ncbi:ParB/RepB/Spo0J family partition protein [Streptomyces sp. NRRL S-813]|uniref:ParB/RepB/Spo0J family partition protein n=1 Tax=Streptomyces sp. NRRL S-813 TaxID=1463919 RepID=UPI00068D0E6A|nr:ParB/RepB/Spo0J family partition protein [Streptomyces sp. NRRL S-813]
MTPPQQRVTRGFSMDDDETGAKQPPRRIRTRQQIMNGEGKRPPAKVELKLLAGNPFNPRDELTELEETAESLRAKGQIQPVTVARRTAFLNAHPGLEGKIGVEAEYVVIDGNRRLAAAELAGLTELRIDVNDDLAGSAVDILEAALIANIHRVDVPAMDQAKAIQELVKVHGSQGQVAKKLGKTPAWVSQRLALLELTPDLQEKVETGELKMEPARRIGRLPKDQQAGEAERAINAVKTPRQRRREPVDDGSQATTVNAVNTAEAAAGAVSPALPTVNAVNTPAAPDTRADADADSPEQGEAKQPKRLPYDDPMFIAQHLQLKMTPADFAQMTKLCAAFLRDQDPEEFQVLVRDLNRQVQPS